MEVRVGNPDAERDFFDVRDVVEAYLTLLTKATDLPARTIFNIASGRPAAIKDILNRLRALSYRDIEVVQGTNRLRPSEVSRAAVDIAAITTLGWAPRHTLDDVLSQILEYQRNYRNSKA